MCTLYVDRKEIHIKLDGNALAFYENGVRMGTAPIVPLKRVVITGSAVIETPRAFPKGAWWYGEKTIPW